MNQAQLRHMLLKRRFMWQQILRGAAAVLIITGLIFLFDHLFSDAIDSARCYLLQRAWMIYFLFLFSEMLGSLFPPEFFIIALSRESLWLYVAGVAGLALLSYGAAVAMYSVGHGLRSTLFFRRFSARFFRRELRQVKRFGGLLIILSALTPISFTLVCLLVGAADFSMGYFLRYAAFRYARFVFYGFSLWHVMSSDLPC